MATTKYSYSPLLTRQEILLDMLSKGGYYLKVVPYEWTDGFGYINKGKEVVLKGKDKTFKLPPAFSDEFTDEEILFSEEVLRGVSLVLRIPIHRSLVIQ